MARVRAPQTSRTAKDWEHLAQRLDTLVSTLATGVVELDLEGRFTYGNPAAERVLGLTNTAYLGRTAEELGIIRYDAAGQRVEASQGPVMTAGRGGRGSVQSVYRYSGLTVPDIWLEAETTPILSATGELVGVVASFIDVTARFALEAVQRAADQRLNDILRHTAVGVLMVDAEGRIEYANAAALGGRQSSDVLGQLAADPAWRIMNEHGEVLAYGALPVPTALRERREVRDVTLGFPGPGSEVRWARVTVIPLVRPDGSLRGAVVTLDDTTERRALAAQLAQAQKMDAIGQLAGGIAHDFNNLLTSILGNTELALAAVPTGSTVVQDLAEVREAVFRGAALTGRVLTFARKQVGEPQFILLDQLTASTQKLLERALGEQIVLRRESDADLWTTRADPREMEQVIINLAINARDAMPEGGELIMGTHNRLVDSVQAAQQGVEPGEYVALSLRDTGVGIAPDVVGRIFEPFFTTKPVGRGTGLGLSICYGVAKQSRGFITVDSTVGRGTTFTFYAPRARGTPSPPAVAEDHTTPARATGTILVVEDQEGVRNLIARVLSAAGYQVITAGNGPEALALQQRTPRKLDLLITDVIMPHMRGPEIAGAMRERQPDLAVLFVTGYAGVQHAEAPGFDAMDEVVAKPFTPQQLLRSVQRGIARHQRAPA